MTDLSTACFACGRSAQDDEVLVVRRPFETSGLTIHLHPTCTNRFVVQLLTVSDLAVQPVPHVKAADHSATLTSRESDILRLLTGGDSNGEIARKLQLSPLTVKTRVETILSKLEVRSRTEAAVLAVRLGLVE